jgi:hypothetical protein
MKSWTHHRLLFNSVLLTILLFSVVSRPDNVQADVAPPEPPIGSNPRPGDELTNVRMMAETVVMDISAGNPTDEGLAKVTATFTMRNLGEKNESMIVRFPLYDTRGLDNYCISKFDVEYTAFYFPPIRNLMVWVNGVFTETQIIYKEFIVDVYSHSESSYVQQPKQFPCWASFPVIFPHGQDVIIKVVYSTLPYDHYKLGEFRYNYILMTGEGWKGTIGSADIIYHLPYDLDQVNFLSCYPEDCAVTGKTIQWHFEDFEPNWGTSASLVSPSIWQKILTERAKTIKNPADGEAWGRLGKAYKEACMIPYGFRSDASGLELYQLSSEAYQQALLLLPDDADWHFGFAELLCQSALFKNNDYSIEPWQKCIQQLKFTLEINPDHPQANEFIHRLKENDYGVGKIVDLSGTEPDYLILTAQPTLTSTVMPALSQTPTQSNGGATTTVQSTHVQTGTVENKITSVPEMSSTQPDQPTSNPESDLVFPLLVIGFTVLFVVMVVRVRNKNR